jgi:hypothetical protein
MLHESGLEYGENGAAVVPATSKKRYGQAFHDHEGF